MSPTALLVRSKYHVFVENRSKFLEFNYYDLQSKDMCIYV